ncbi:MAG TPA: choice-of-anchor tandem repeat GloVer-containing protein [Candidatus Dormibacteraeota bacterium]|nr:choice-of-anchor tandem repeat GloVer-containing protein [Candidatus Dormibacteraeota bacterium]
MATALAMVLLATLAMAPSAQAQTYTVLYNFTDGSDGAGPSSPLTRDSAGNFYGTVQQGGDSSNCGGVGYGTVFKIDAHGKETVLSGFSGGADGGNLARGLILSGSTFTTPRYSEVTAHAMKAAESGGVDGGGPGSVSVDKRHYLRHYLFGWLSGRNLDDHNYSVAGTAAHTLVECYVSRGGEKDEVNTDLRYGANIVCHCATCLRY